MESEFHDKIPAESNLGQRAAKHIATVKESTYQDTKRRHLQNLTDKTAAVTKKSTDSSVDLSGSQLKKWVISLSKYKLNSAKTSVLAKGLNYAVSPQDVCAEEFVLATELACKNLPQADGIQLRAKIANVLRTSKPPEQNVNKEKRQAIKELKKEESIIILPADNGKSTVVLDKTEYEEKVHLMLSDKKDL